MAVGSPALAAVTLVTPGVGEFVVQAPFDPNGAGLYGVEVRSGKPGAQDWEIGVGSGTSQAGHFNQGQATWVTGVDQAFSLTWTASSLSFTLNGVTTVTDAGVGKSAPLVGNTLRVAVKNLAFATIGTVDGVAFNQAMVGGDNLYFYSADNFGGDGFTVTGTMRMRQGGSQGVGGSTDGVTFKNGQYNAVPEPATWAMMIMGFGLTGSLIRRRRLAPTAA